MHAPKLNINGTSGTALLDQYENAIRAVQNATDVVQQCAPHPRDWQTGLQEDYRLARQQHIRWLTLLDDIQKEIEAVVIEVLNQIPPKQGRL